MGLEVAVTQAMMDPITKHLTVLGDRAFQDQMAQQLSLLMGLEEAELALQTGK
jgi:hypothetical protein